MQLLFFSRSREPLAPMSVKIRRNLGWICLGVVALLMLSIGFWVAGASAEQSTLLAKATRQLDGGELEAARATLDGLGRRPLLPAPVRRQVASHYFRLGDDVAAHNVLRGLKVRAGDAEDRALQEWSGRCLRASERLKRADESRNTADRVRYAREAAKELPDAPAVLQRLVLEELLAMTRSTDPSYGKAFERSYMELRMKAPTLAAEVKKKVADAMATGSGLTER